MRLRRLLLFFWLSLVVLVSLAGWLLATQSGLQHSLSWLQAASAGRLQVGQADGRWLGPLRLEEISWQDAAGTAVRAQQLQLEWQPAALGRGELRVDRLVLGRLDITTAPDDAGPVPEPAQITLPLALSLPALHISHLQIDALPPLLEVEAQLNSDGVRHQLEQLAFTVAAVRVSAQARLDGQAPFPLQASAQISGQLVARPFTLALTADGPLASLPLEIVAQEGVHGQAEVTLTPFAPVPFSSARIDLAGVHPVDWADSLPAAELALQATFEPVGEAELTGIVGSFAIANSLPGPLDLDRVPVQTLSGQVDWRGGSLNLPSLRLQLPAGGQISGQGRWQGSAEAGHLDLDLAVRGVNAQVVHRRLHKTALEGRIKAALSARAQQLEADLRDRRFSLAGAVRQADAVLTIERLLLQASGTGLSASGRVTLDEARDITLAAELKEFNPRAFADLPAARVNASATVAGNLRAAPVIAADFKLRDSHFRQVPLAGAGNLRLAWPRITGADLWLSLGKNRLEVRGALGQPADQLQFELRAPQLADLGGDGSVHGQFRLAGSLEALRLSGELQSPRLGWPGLFSAEQLHLATDVSTGKRAASATAPLALELSLARLDLPGQVGLAEKLALKVSGNRQQHLLNFSTRLFGDDQLQLRASGGVSSQPELVWQGAIDTLQLHSRNSARNVRLQSPASLRLSQTAWRLADLHLAGNPLDWQARLGAEVRNERLNLTLAVDGSRFGRLAAQLAARMDGAWALDRRQPWQGEVSLQAEDLAWLGELMGEGRRTGGRLRGQLQLAGTPALPQLQGNLSGQALRFALEDSGLQLQDGELSARIAGDVLHLETLRFSSPHRALPRPLKRSLGETAARHEPPGQLTASGELRLDAQAASGAAQVMVKLDRVGVWQQPEQWVSLSGETLLSWQRDHLGGKGALTVDAAYWQLAPPGAPSLSDDVVVRRPAQSATPSLRPKLSLDVSVDFGRDFLFEGAGLSSLLVGQIRLTAEGRDLPRAVGSIRTRNGRFAAYGQALEIERGILNFQGLPDNPSLDVRAMRRGLTVEAGVEVTGTVQKPRVRLVSTPELPEAEKLSWLILGHGPEGVGSGDASVLLAAAGDLFGNASGNLVGQLKDRFGIDEFGVRQGTLGGGARSAGSRIVSSGGAESSGVEQQILSVGKRISSRATLNYEQSLGTAESVAKLSFDLTRQLTLVGRVGSDNALDLFYSITWGRPPRGDKTNVGAPVGTPTP